LEPGVEGLIPISEMGWSRVKHSTDATSPGSVVDCVVIRVEADQHRIALSMKQAQDDPWAGVFESFPAQSLVQGKVTRLADFGVFVEIAPGVEGLVHISELADRRVIYARGRSMARRLKPVSWVWTRKPAISLS
jgi:small subunit ribosomal protein S1